MDIYSSFPMNGAMEDPPGAYPDTKPFQTQVWSLRDGGTKQLFGI